jgi:VanZ family protein
MAVLTAAFAAYISLVPFNFTRPAGTTLGEAFRQSLATDVVSRSNFAGNILLFIPIGFFGAGAILAGTKRRGRRVIGAVGLVASSIVLSLAIEFLQVLVPGRTPSLADVTAQTAGTLAGLTTWVVVSRDILRWAGRRESERGHGALRLGLVVFAVARAVAMLLPLDVTLDLGRLAEKYRAGLIVLNPLRSPDLTWSDLPARLADLTLSIPIGAAAILAWMPAGRRRQTGVALFLGWTFMGFIEAAQVLVVSRTADVADFLVNALGVAAGVWVTSRLLPDRSAPAPAPASRVPLAGLAVSLAAYLLYNWSPFDFEFSGDVIHPRIPRLLEAPFYGYYQNPEIKAVGELIVKIVLGMPIGVFLGWFIVKSASQYRRLAVAVASVLVISFFSLVEAGQVLLPTRYPDNTDILLGIAGVVAGGWMVRRFGR